MKNKIKSFRLFVKDDEGSRKIAENIRKFNEDSKIPLKERKDGDLVIAIGGDGTFLEAVTATRFCKEKVYAGVHTGTLGFLQNMSPGEIYAFIKYFRYQKKIMTRKVRVADITVCLKNGKNIHYNALNEVLITGKHRRKISFAEYLNGELFQNISANGISIATNTGDTAYSMNNGGSIDFSTNCQLVRTLEVSIQNAVNENFIRNPVVCSDFYFSMKPSKDIEIIIDGIPKEISSKKIKAVQVSMRDNSNYIHKFELQEYSKAKTIREKILGYKD